MGGWHRWPLLPVHALALASGAKSFEKNPFIGSQRLNRLGLHLARRTLAARLGERRRAALGAGLSEADRAAILAQGYLAKPRFLPDDAFAAMRDELFAARLNAREFLDGHTLTRLIPLDAASLSALPATRSALEFPAYRALHDFVGSFQQAPFLFVQTVFSHVRDAPPDIQSVYHTDTFHPTVKSWLFLDDVAEGEAGFTYVPGSHRPNRRHLAWERRVSINAAEAADRSTREGSLRVEEETLARLGYPAPRKFAVGANTLVIADTSGIHRRGLADRPTRRVSIWAYARGNPFKPWTGGDVLSATGLDKRVIRGFWAAQDLLGRLSGRQSGWRWVGPRGPLDPPAL
jgi:hypothetical protein